MSTAVGKICDEISKSLKIFEIDELHLHEYQIYFDTVAKTHVHNVIHKHMYSTTNYTLFASIE